MSNYVFEEESRVNWKSSIMVSFVRTANGLSRESYCKKLDISPVELAMIEEGRVLPKMSLIRKICQKTKLSFAQMCGESESPREACLFS